MTDKYKIGWLVLNLQLLIAIIMTYDHLQRHLIGHNIFTFYILVVSGSNLLFYLFKKIKYFSLRALICILLASLISTVVVVKYNKLHTDLTLPMQYFLIIGYITIIFNLFVTTPLAILLEIILRWKKK
jgi:FlaA1/EpsC-like NDP-sugar epimerase